MGDIRCSHDNILRENNSEHTQTDIIRLHISLIETTQGHVLIQVPAVANYNIHMNIYM